MRSLKPTPLPYRSYDLARLDFEESCLPGRQQVEDLRMERAIRNAAMDQYMQYLDAKSKHDIFLWQHPEAVKWMGTEPVFICIPFVPGVYTIHHEATAKYKDANISDLIMEEYIKLKNAHESKIIKENS